MLMVIGAALLFIVVYIRDLKLEIAELHEITLQSHEILNPPLSDEALAYEDSVEIADSHVQNEELSNRVARLKEEMALAQFFTEKSPKHTPYITPLHPDVYN